MTQHIRILILSLILLIVPGVTFAAGSDTFTVVIDAGHGGHDTGAMDNGVKEKDINLGVALKVGEMIKSKMKGAKVVYTRDKDNFITLQGRADKANNAKGDIFVSIHTNSVDASNKNRTTVTGASTYVLGLHKDKENMAVARRENSVMSLEKNKETYNGFDPDSDESYIIFEMAQKQDLSRSILLAKEVQKQLYAKAERRDRGVHQAGFWVLWATSMPAILVELDFICNPNSAKYISSPQGQEKLAEGIFQAIKNYREQEKKLSVEQDADRGEQDAVSAADYEIAALGTMRSEKVLNASAVHQQNSASQKRRRRSKASRQFSDSRTIAEATVVEPVVVAVAPAPVETSEKVSEMPADSKSVGKKSKNSKKEGKATRSQIKEDKKKAKNVSQRVVEPSPQQKAMAAKAEKKSKESNDKKEAAAAAKRINDKFDRSGENKKNEKVSKVSQKKEVADKSVKAEDKQKSTSVAKAEKGNSKGHSKRSHGRLDKRNTESAVYKIMLLSADKPLKENDLRLQTIQNASIAKENGKYTYYLGESKNVKELESLLKSVKSSFPDARIIMSSTY